MRRLSEADGLRVSAKVSRLLTRAPQTIFRDKSFENLTVIDNFAIISFMLKIRMQRTGRKHEPTYRLVLSDSKNSTKSGKYLEILGNYDSRHGEKSEIKADRVLHWITKGAQVTPTVHNMLLDKKIITGKKVNKLPLKKAIKRPSAEIAETSVASAEVVSEPEVVVPAEETIL